MAAESSIGGNGRQKLKQWEALFKDAPHVMTAISKSGAEELVNLTKDRFRTETDPSGRAWTAETVNGNGSASDIGALRSAVKLRLTVTALGGSATVYVDTSPDGATGWRQVGQFDAMTAFGQQTRAFDQCDRFVRARWTLTTSLTFSLDGMSHVLFALRDDLTQGSINATALSTMDARVLADCLIKASTLAEAEIATAYPMPLTKWPESVNHNCADVAVFLAMKARGFKPQTGLDDLIVKAKDDAMAWFRALAQGKIKPPGFEPRDNLGVHASSGDPAAPEIVAPKFSNNWGDF